MVDDSVRYLSIQDDNLSFLSMEDSKEYMIESPRYNYLCDVKDAPWNINTLRQALRKVSYILPRSISSFSPNALTICYLISCVTYCNIAMCLSFFPRLLLLMIVLIYYRCHL